jgi:[ribosomal protein S5]-alanine N-acetyltransferase
VNPELRRRVRADLNTEVELAVPRPNDEAEFLALVALSAQMHDGWVNPPSDPEAYDRYLRRISASSHKGFFVRDVASRSLVGVVNVNEIVLGAFRSASLGYYGFVTRSGNGRMTAGVGLVVSHAFGHLGLHRIEANIQPQNAPSKALVERLGFKLEGLSPRYLYVSGAWRDHERWAVLSEDW